MSKSPSPDGESRTYQTTLILDYRTGKFRAIKKKPRSYKPSEIPIDFSLKINLPKQVQVKATGEITLTEQKVSEIVVDQI